MARIFITGSSDGIGLSAARTLTQKGHTVTLHARSPSRALALQPLFPSSKILIGDLSSISQTKALAAEADKLGKFDTVIHNAGIGYATGYEKSEDGLADVFAVNALAPYILTSLMERPGRVVVVSSGLHLSSDGEGVLRDVGWREREKRWDGMRAYCDSKLMNVILAFAVARYWTDVKSNALSPGWVKTKMGGTSAPGSVEKGARLLVQLADCEEDDIGTGEYYSGEGRGGSHSAASDVKVQDEFLRVCEENSGVSFLKWE